MFGAVFVGAATAVPASSVAASAVAAVDTHAAGSAPGLLTHSCSLTARPRLLQLALVAGFHVRSCTSLALCTAAMLAHVSSSCTVCTVQQCARHSVPRTGKSTQCAMRPLSASSHEVPMRCVYVTEVQLLPG